MSDADQNPEGYLVIRRARTGRDRTEAPPYPAKVIHFRFKEAAEACLAKGRIRYANDPNQMLGILKCEGWVLVIRNLKAPEGTKPSYKTYPTFAQANQNATYMRAFRQLSANEVEIIPYVPPAKKPKRQPAPVNAERELSASILPTSTDTAC